MSPFILHELRPLKAIHGGNAGQAGQTAKDVSLIIPARNANDGLISTVREAHAYLNARFPASFEIILVPNPAPGNKNDRSLEISQKIAAELPEVRVCLHEFPPGKGAAIRTGFQACQGRWIFFTDSDLPYDLAFFDAAVSKLRQGYDLVTGNRRLPESHFRIPVGLLPLAYGRHRLGLGFNRLVRWLLPLKTTDTQAGIKAMSRRLAEEAFSRQQCPGFLFDLEIFLTAVGQGYLQCDLPVTLYLNSEKSTIRILRECILVANWLTRIWLRYRTGGYGKPKNAGTEIRKRYRRSQPGLSTRFFLWARWILTPYQKMVSHLPLQGRVLDLGCGHGFLSMTAALTSPSREVLGIDHDSDRIKVGSQASDGISNLKLAQGSMLNPPEDVYSAITMIDVMHYFNPQIQNTLVEQARKLLEAQGILLIREVDPHGGWISKWNRLYEKWATAVGFTQTSQEGLYFRTQEGWKELMESHGFQVKSERCSSFLFADILYVCIRQ